MKVRHVLLVGVLGLGVLVAVTRYVDDQRRAAALEAVVAEVMSAPDGSSVDLARALPLDWDRAVVLPPYTYGEDSNRLLGFDQFPKDEGVTSGDGTYLVLFVRDRSVIAELGLYGQSFYFDESVESFGSATFTVEHDRGEVVLIP
jgi:hypothetical protein